MPAPVAGGVLVAKAAAKLIARHAPKVVRFARLWAPYYVCKFAAVQIIKKHGSVPVYRVLLRANRRLMPVPDQPAVQRSIRTAFRLPGQGQEVLQHIDSVLVKLIQEAPERSDVPEHLLSDAELYLMMRGELTLDDLRCHFPTNPP